MAKIPGREGLGQARPDVQRMTVSGGSDALQQGAQHLATRVGQIADEGLQRIEEANRLKTAAGLAQYQTDLATVRNRIQNDLNSGGIASREDAQKRFEEESLTLSTALYDQVPKSLRDMARVKGDELLNQQSMGLGEFLDGHATSEARGNLDTLRKSLTTQGLADEGSLAAAKAQFSTAITANARALRYTPEEQAKQLNDFAGDSTFLHYSNRLAEKPDDIGYIRQLKGRLSDEKQLTDLDSPRRIQLMHQADALENAWESEQRRKKAEAEARIATDAEEVRSFLLGGGDISKLNGRDRARFNLVMGSDKYGTKAKGWLQTNRDVTRLNSLPIRDQQTALLEAESRMNKAQGLEAFNDARDTLAALQQNHSRNVQEYRADPFTYTATTLLKEDIAPIDWTNAGTLPQQLKARREQAARASKMQGGRVPPLTAGDAAMVAQVVNGMPPQEGAKFLTLVSGAVGVENMPLVSQLMSKDGDPALVGAAALAGKQSSEGRPVSALALRGRDVIKNKEVKLPEESGLRASFAADTGMGGSAMEYPFQTALAIYAAKARESGITEPSSGKPDPRLWSEAVSMATGGVYDFRGEKLVAPIYGVKQADFEDRLHTIDANAIKRDAGEQQLYVDGRPITYEKAQSYLREAPLGNGSREGTVWVRAGSGMIMQADGKPLMVTIPAATVKGSVPFRVNTSMMMPGM